MRRIFGNARWKDIIESVVWHAIANDYVTEDEFPPTLRSYYHPTQFVEPKAYRNALAKIEADEANLLEQTKHRPVKRRKATRK
jgi:hypothetical protein